MKFINHVVKIDEQTQSEEIIRQKYGSFVSVFSIISNVLLFVLKFIVGIISNSVSIKNDAFNNLSDAMSNISSLVGFVISNRHADKDHPYGHGRSEYIAGMIISFLILLVGFQSLLESINKIITPEVIKFNYPTLIVLLFSIVVKLIMAIINKRLGNRIRSTTLLAASKDSLNDVLATSATLVSLVASLYSNVSIDGYMGVLVSIFILKSGIEVFKDTSSPLLGQNPNSEFMNEIIEFVTSFDKVLGVHDLMVHDYGVTQKFITLHVEVASDCNLVEIHNVIDEIERKMQEKFHMIATIHYDPIDVDDEYTNQLRSKIEAFLLAIDSNYSMHDFRIIKGKKHIRIIFDVVIPIDDYRNEEEIKKILEEKITNMDDCFESLICVEHSYVNLEKE